MATKLDPILLGPQKNIAPKQLDVGKIVACIAQDLEEYGEKGVQGLKVKSADAKRLLAYESASVARQKSSYAQVGVFKKDLFLVVRDKKDKSYEQMALLVKDYTDAKQSLADNEATVVKLAADKDDPTIVRAAAARADKFGTTVKEEADAEVGTVKGDIILCAHGGADSSASGRVIGTKLGRQSADDLVQFLTLNADPKKRIAPDYNGTIRLSGCFTGSGGPEAHEADEGLARNVWAKLRQAGYDKCSVVGVPGPAKWANADGEQDGSGTAMKKGDPHSAVAVASKEDLKRFESMMKEFQATKKEEQELRDDARKRTEQHKDVAAKIGAGVSGEAGIKLVEAKDRLETEIQKLRLELAQNAKRMAALNDLLKDERYAKLLETQAGVKGTFGARTLN